MTTVINTPGNNTDNGDGGAGWAVAVIILLAVIGIGAYFLFYNRGAAPATNGAIDVNVTLPTPTQNSEPKPAL